jgi:hypothetical protein
MPRTTDADVLASTQRWLERAVIGLNLCPFAKAVHLKRQIRWVVSPARNEGALAEHLLQELRQLAEADPVQTETTLLVHPHVLQDFEAYNDFLDIADALLVNAGLEGTLQVASFHPDYRFADSPAGDPADFTNRSPHPMLHLLRESSVERAVQAYPDAAGIFERNVRTLRRLGAEGWWQLFEDRL